MKKIIFGAAIFSLSMMVNAQSASVTVTSSAAESEKAAEAAELEDIQIHSGVTITKDNGTRCIRNTGSRVIDRGRHGCNGASGRSYDKEDLDRTGAQTVGEALQLLDPSIQIRR